jgi:hypothetical protein
LPKGYIGQKELKEIRHVASSGERNELSGGMNLWRRGERKKEREPLDNSCIKKKIGGKCLLAWTGFFEQSHVPFSSTPTKKILKKIFLSIPPLTILKWKRAP